MSLRRVQSWVWWLLPILVARALLPVGFMPQAQGGQLQMVLCQSGFTQLGIAQLRGLETHSADAKSIDSRSAADAKSDAVEVAAAASQHAAKAAHWQHDVSCSFAHAVAAPIPVISGTDAIALLPAAENPAPVTPPYESVGPPRFIATRGPPTLI